MVYYWDLLPVINMTRVINHLIAVMPQVDANISILHFLQPIAATSHSILLLLFNLMVFNEEQLRNITPREEELFAKSGQVCFAHRLLQAFYSNNKFQTYLVCQLEHWKIMDIFF